MNESSSEVVAEAKTELTTPAKRTAKAMTAIAAVATASEFEASVPRHTKTPQTTESANWACRRSRIGPVKSTSSTMAKEPNAANVASAGLPMTRSPSANIAGMTIAARPARRSARRPGSWARSQ